MLWLIQDLKIPSLYLAFIPHDRKRALPTTFFLNMWCNNVWRFCEGQETATFRPGIYGEEGFTEEPPRNERSSLHQGCYRVAEGVAAPLSRARRLERRCDLAGGCKSLPDHPVSGWGGAVLRALGLPARGH